MTDAMEPLHSQPSPDEAEEVPTEDRWETLGQAFAAYHYPMENLPLVQRLVDHVGIDHYRGIRSRSYINGIRRSAGRNLHIHFGWTSGIVSENEILNSVGNVDRGSWWDGREWWMTHPINKLRDGNGASSGWTRRDYGFCEEHGMELPASGICDFC